MHFYPWHVGDYMTHTRHLTEREDLAFRRMLDAYYTHEQPFNGGSTVVARMIGMRDAVEEVEAVLREFFETDDGGDTWRNRRADREIERYREKCDKASAAGKASAAKRKLNACSTDVQPTKNHEPVTMPRNQDPRPAAEAAEMAGWLAGPSSCQEQKGEGIPSADASRAADVADLLGKLTSKEDA